MQIASLILNGLSLLAVLLCFFYFLALKRLITRIKIKFSQNRMGLKLVYKNMHALENKIDGIATLLSNLEKQSHVKTGVRDEIESQYERAKRLIKSAAPEARDKLNLCNVTAEEIELLSSLGMTDINNISGVG